MKQRNIIALVALAGCAAALVCAKATRVFGASDAALAEWDRHAAARYLDDREVWWQGWPHAQKDHGTICISCHTSVPYAMARPALRRELNEAALTPSEKIMLDSVEKRVSHWSEMTPFYSDAGYGPGKTAESHATEAVLNAVILASYDARQGHLRPITRTAFDAAWALQLDTGGWQWQDFHLAPWESVNSAYQGAALFALSAGKAPDGYANETGVQPHLQRLRDYLRREYATQPLMNQVYVLWAGPKVPGLLSTAERDVLLKKLEDLQQPDGGWRLSTLHEWKRSDSSLDPTGSDGLATSLAVLALESLEKPAARQEAMLKRGVTWLEQHQEKSGDWRASSLNKQRDPESDIGRFMSDAATGYAVLALESSRQRRN